MPGSFDPTLLESEIVQALIERISRKVTEQVIAEHIKSCPHGLKLAVRFAWLGGLCVGSGLIGGGLGAAIVRGLAGAG